jgi:hypothetical protein
MVSLSEALVSTIANLHCSQSKIVSGYEYIDITTDDHVSWENSSTKTKNYNDTFIIERNITEKKMKCPIQRKYSLDTMLTEDTNSKDSKDSNSNLLCSGTTRSSETSSMMTRYKNYRNRSKRASEFDVHSNTLTQICPIPKLITISNRYNEKSPCFVLNPPNTVRKDCSTYDFVPLCELALLMSNDLKGKFNEAS